MWFWGRQLEDRKNTGLPDKIQSTSGANSGMCWFEIFSTHTTKILGRQLDTQVWSSGERSGLEIEIWEWLDYGWFIHSFETGLDNQGIKYINRREEDQILALDPLILKAKGEEQFEWEPVRKIKRGSCPENQANKVFPGRWSDHLSNATNKSSNMGLKIAHKT